MRCKAYCEECFKALPVEEKLSDLKVLMKNSRGEDRRIPSIAKGKNIYKNHEEIKKRLKWCSLDELTFMRHKVKGEQISYQALNALTGFIAFGIASLSLLTSFSSGTETSTTLVLELVGIIFAFMALYYLAMVLSTSGLRRSTYLVDLFEEEIQEKRALEKNKP